MLQFSAKSGAAHPPAFWETDPFLLSLLSAWGSFGTHFSVWLQHTRPTCEQNVLASLQVSMLTLLTTLLPHSYHTLWQKTHMRAHTHARTHTYTWGGERGETEKDWHPLTPCKAPAATWSTESELLSLQTRTRKCISRLVVLPLLRVQFNKCFPCCSGKWGPTEI